MFRPESKFTVSILDNTKGKGSATPDSLSASRSRPRGHAPWNQWQGTQPHAGGTEDRVRHRRRDGDQRCLARSHRRLILAIHDDHVDLRKIAEARDPVAAEVGILDLAILKLNGFK